MIKIPSYYDIANILTFDFNLLIVKENSVFIAKLIDYTLDHILSHKLIEFINIKPPQKEIAIDLVGLKKENDKTQLSRNLIIKNAKKRTLNIKEKKKIKKNIFSQIMSKKEKILEKERINRVDKKMKRINFSSKKEEKKLNNAAIELNNIDDTNKLEDKKDNVYIIVNDNPKSNKRSNEDFLISDEELQLIKNNYEEIRFNLPCNKFKKLHKYKDGDEKCKCFETNYTNYMLMSSVKFKLNLRKKQRHRFKKT